MPLIRCYFITPTSSQPRYHKRIQACRVLGHPVTVFTFQRGLYKVNTLPPDVEIVELGEVRSGRYLSRILSLVRAVHRVRSIFRGSREGGILYCFGLDCALLGLLAKPKWLQLVYEVGDIIYLLRGQSRFVKITMTLLDRLLTRYVNLLVLTSEGFLPHYRHLNHRCPVSVIENRIVSELAAAYRPVHHPLPTPIRIGFVGLIYYLECLHGLISFVAAHEGYEAHFFGDGEDIESILAAAERHRGRVFYHGPFRNPEDLPAIYEQIDVNFVVYDPDDENVRMLIPNKYYESIFFAVPLVVADGTLLAERVRSQGIGYCIDARRIGAELERVFSTLTRERYVALCVAARSIPTEEITDESARLISQLTGLTGAATTEGESV